LPGRHLDLGVDMGMVFLILKERAHDDQQLSRCVKGPCRWTTVVRGRKPQALSACLCLVSLQGRGTPALKESCRTCALKDAGRLKFPGRSDGAYILPMGFERESLFIQVEIYCGLIRHVPRRVVSAL
jgi:hypothetical protein